MLLTYLHLSFGIQGNKYRQSRGTASSKYDGMQEYCHANKACITTLKIKQKQKVLPHYNGEYLTQSEKHCY